MPFVAQHHTGAQIAGTNLVTCGCTTVHPFPNYKKQPRAASCNLQLIMGPTIEKLWWECYQTGKIMAAGEPHPQPQY